MDSVTDIPWHSLMPMWISLFLLLLTYFPDDSGAFCFVMVMTYLYLWLRRVLSERPVSVRPPPLPDPIHIKSYKLAVKECKWRLDAYILPLAVWVLWYVVNPVSATPHSQLFFACVFGWVMFRWLCRRSVDVAQRMDWASTSAKNER
jgi:hypothetical protein